MIFCTLKKKIITVTPKCDPKCLCTGLLQCKTCEAIFPGKKVRKKISICIRKYFIACFFYGSHEQILWRLKSGEIIPRPLPDGLIKHLRLDFHKADCGKVETGTRIGWWKAWRLPGNLLEEEFGIKFSVSSSSHTFLICTLYWVPKVEKPPQQALYGNHFILNSSYWLGHFREIPWICLILSWDIFLVVKYCFHFFMRFPHPQTEPALSGRHLGENTMNMHWHLSCDSISLWPCIGVLTNLEMAESNG